MRFYILLKHKKIYPPMNLIAKFCVLKPKKAIWLLTERNPKLLNSIKYQMENGNKKSGILFTSW